MANDITWHKVKLGDIVECWDSKRVYLKGDEREAGNIPLYGGGGIADYVKDYLFNEELILLSEDGGPFFDKSRPVAFYVTDKVWVSGHIHVLKAKPGVDAYLVTQLLNAVDYKNYITGAVIPKLNKSNMLSIELSIPDSIDEQKRIANLLSKFDELIQINEFKASNLIKAKTQLMNDIFSGGLRGLPDINPEDFVQSDWVKVKLGDICDIKAGGDIDKSRVSDVQTDVYKYPVYANALTNKGLFGYTDTYKHSGKTVTVTGRGDIGHAVARECAFYPIVRLLVLTPKYSNLDTKFLEYCINNLEFPPESTGVPQLTTKKLGIREISIPPTLQEQKQIASLLSSYDELIQLNRDKLSTVNKMKAQLMNQVFAERERESWITVKLGELCSIKTGKLNANAMVENGQYPFFTCSRETFKIDTYAFDGEALLIAGNGDVGFTKYYNGKFNAYQRTYVLMQFSNVDAKYIYHYLNCYLPARVEAEMSGSAVPYIKLGTLADMEIRVPTSISEQQSIANLFQAYDGLADSIQKSIDTLEKEKNSIMQKIFA